MKGDRTLDRLQYFGYIIGDGNEDGRYNIYGAHGKILLSNIETEKSADGIGINRNGDKLAVSDMNGVRIFDLITNAGAGVRKGGRQIQLYCGKSYFLPGRQC